MALVHWNSPDKLAVRLPNIESFLAAERLVTNLDGSLLQRSPMQPRRTLPSTLAPDTSQLPVQCLQAVPSLNASTVMRFFPRFACLTRPGMSPEDVTLVTAMTADRMELLRQLARSYSGPLR